MENLAGELNFRKQVLGKKKAAENAEAAANRPSQVPIVLPESVAGEAVESAPTIAPGDVVCALPRPTASALVKHNLESAKRKRAEEVKETDIDAEEAKKNKRAPKKDKSKPDVPPFQPTPAGIPEDKYAAAAAVFSQVTFPGIEVPPLPEMMNQKGFGRVAYQSLQCNAEVVRTCLGYEKAVKTLTNQVGVLKSQLSETSKKHEETLSAVVVRAKKLEEENQVLKACQEAKEKRIEELKGEVEVAALKARAELKAEVAAKVLEAKAKMVEFKKTVLPGFVFDRQIENNLTFLDEMESEGANKTLADYKKELLEHAPTYQAAGPAFYKGFNSLLDGLEMSPERSSAEGPSAEEPTPE